MTARPPQLDGQHEPSYPDDETVVYSIRYGDLTVHRPLPRCAIEAPHMITECGAWQAAHASMMDDNPMGGARALGCAMLGVIGAAIVALVLIVLTYAG